MAAQTPPPAVATKAQPDAQHSVARAVRQEVDGPWRRLRGAAEVDTLDSNLKADEIDYNSETEYAEARGNVIYVKKQSGERIQCDRAEYYFDTGMAKFYKVSGTSPAKIDARPGLLTTSNPFYFEGDWAEKIRENVKGRIRERYVLHDGFVTDCKIPRPAWILEGSTFDIVPEDRVIAKKATYRLKGIPLFYAPAAYKSLKRSPRKSGFMLPNMGLSSRRGFTTRTGYYWAINRSYDLTYTNNYFSSRGFGHTADFRGKPTESSDFNFYLYGVNDRGIKIGDTIEKQGGYLTQFNGRTELPKGFTARAQINYLSNFRFRQNFTETFVEAIQAETHSTAYIAKHWDANAFHLVYQRDENFQSAEPDDKILLRQLPSVNFLSRERQVNRKVLPVWVSLDSTFGLLHRDQPQFQTRQYVDRGDIAPRVMTNLNWKGISLTPSFSARGTHYGSSFVDGRVRGDGIWRFSREFLADLTLPSLARVSSSPRWLGGEKMKHVIETRATFRHVGGVQDFDRIVRFDSTELVTNTTEIEYSLANRLYVKDKGGSVREVMSWELWQRRYLDPDMGGAVVDGRRNVVSSSIAMTGFAFFDAARRYSPVVSSFRFSPNHFGVEWRADYDPLRGQIVNSTVLASSRWSQYFITAGHNQVRSHPVLAPNSNQFQNSFGFGNDNRRGWNAGATSFYDYRERRLTYITGQVTYNWDCCGVAFQYRRFDVGNRIEPIFRWAFSVANIGSFGTLRRQEKLF